MKKNVKKGILFGVAMVNEANIKHSHQKYIN